MTFQRPAYEQVTIALGGNTVTLRPSLRAAATLEARHGFPALIRALDEINLTTISEIILSASTSRQDAAAFLWFLSGRPLLPFINAVREPLADLISMFTPAPVQSLDTTPRTGKPMPWGDFYRDLYDLATGWLGWTPETAWNATPTEVTRAHAAHIAKLKAIHGSSEPERSEHDPREDVSDADARSGLEKLRANAKRGGA